MSTFCFLSKSRAPKMCTEKELKYLTKQADSAKYKKFSQWFPDQSYVENYFTHMLTAPVEPAKTSTSVIRATNLKVKESLHLRAQSDKS